VLVVGVLLRCNVKEMELGKGVRWEWRGIRVWNGDGELDVGMLGRYSECWTGSRAREFQAVLCDTDTPSNNDLIK